MSKETAYLLFEIKLNEAQVLSAVPNEKSSFHVPWIFRLKKQWCPSTTGLLNWKVSISYWTSSFFVLPKASRKVQQKNFSEIIIDIQGVLYIYFKDSCVQKNQFLYLLFFATRFKRYSLLKIHEKFQFSVIPCKRYHQR